MPRMVLIPDQGAIQKLAAASADPAFGYRVHAGRPHVAEHGPDPGAGEDRVERGRVVRATVADHELGPMRLLAEVHDQVASLLGGPFSGWVQGDSENADAPGGFQNSATDADLDLYAARSYSLMRPPRMGRRLIRFRERSATGWSGRGGWSWRLRCGRHPL